MPHSIIVIIWKYNFGVKLTLVSELRAKACLSQIYDSYRVSAVSAFQFSRLKFEQGNQKFQTLISPMR